MMWMQSRNVRFGVHSGQSRLHACRVQQRKRAPLNTVAVYTDNTTPSQASPSPLFEAFFYGRAFAQVLNERLGEVATDVLSEAGKFAAEWDDNVASFEQEVQQRAANAQAEALGQPVTAKTALLPKNVAGSTTRGSVTPTQQDVGAVVDALRADIAAARAALRQVKQSSSSNIS